MENHWEKCFERLEGIFNAFCDPDNCLNLVRQLTIGSPRAHSRFLDSVKGYVKNNMLSFIRKSAADDLHPSGEPTSSSVSALLDIGREQRARAKWISQGTSEGEDDVIATVYEAFAETLDLFPSWRTVVMEHLAEQQGELFQAPVLYGDEILRLPMFNNS